MTEIRSNRFINFLIVAATALMNIVLAPVLAFAHSVYERFYNVERVLGGFTRLENRLTVAARVANERADSFYARADAMEDAGNAATNDADRAYRAQQRISKLLD